MASRKIQVEKLAPAIGAEIHGVDLSKGVDDSLFDSIHEALLEHQVIFFRDQDLGIEQHMELAERFGMPLYSKKLRKYSEEYDTLSLLENDGSQIAAGSIWHTDNTDFEEPPMGSVLYCEIAPSVGGDTLWSSMYAAYDSLSEPVKQLAESLTALHDNSNVKRRYADAGILPKGGLEVNPPVAHPVVHVHPVTGRKALFVNSNYTTGIAGLSDIESQAILKMLCDHAVRPEFQVRFRWRAGSLAIWDNRCTQHHALGDYRELRRMRRVQIAGHRPIPPEGRKDRSRPKAA